MRPDNTAARRTTRCQAVWQLLVGTARKPARSVPLGGSSKHWKPAFSLGQGIQHSLLASDSLSVPATAPVVEFQSAQAAGTAMEAAMDVADDAAVRLGAALIAPERRGEAATPGGALAATGCRRRLAPPGPVCRTAGKPRRSLKLGARDACLFSCCRSLGPTSWWMACTPLRAPCTAAWHSCATRSQVGGRLEAGWPAG